MVGKISLTKQIYKRYLPVLPIKKVATKNKSYLTALLINYQYIKKIL